MKMLVFHIYNFCGWQFSGGKAVGVHVADELHCSMQLFLPGAFFRGRRRSCHNMTEIQQVFTGVTVLPAVGTMSLGLIAAAAAATSITLVRRPISFGVCGSRDEVLMKFSAAPTLSLEKV